MINRRPEKMSFEAFVEPIRKFAKKAKDRTSDGREDAEAIMARYWWIKHQEQGHRADGPAILEDVGRLSKRKLVGTGAGHITYRFLLAERDRHHALAESYSAERGLLIYALRGVLGTRTIQAFLAWVEKTCSCWIVIGKRKNEVVVRGVPMRDG